MFFSGKEVVWRWRQDHGSAWPNKGIIHKTPSVPDGGGRGPCTAHCVQEGQTHTCFDSHFDHSIHLPHLKQRARSYTQSVMAPSDLSVLSPLCHFEKKKQKGSLAFGTKEQKGRRRLLSGNRKQVEADTSVYSTATSKLQLVIVGSVNSPFEIELELLIDFFF